MFIELAPDLGASDAGDDDDDDDDGDDRADDDVHLAVLPPGLAHDAVRRRLKFKKKREYDPFLGKNGFHKRPGGCMQSRVRRLF